MAQAVEAEFSPHEQRVFVKAREEKGRNKKQRWSCRSNPMENRKQNDQERRWKLNKRQLKRKEGMEKGDWEGLAAAGIYLGVYTKTVWESSTAKLKGFEKNVFPKIFFFWNIVSFSQNYRFLTWRHIFHLPQIVIWLGSMNII